MPETQQSFRLSADGVLTVGATKDQWEAPFNGEITSVAAVMSGAPAGSAVIADLKKNGTTLYTTTANRPTILAGATESATEPSPDPDVTTFVAGDTFALDILQIGSGTAGSSIDITVGYVVT